MFDVEGFILVGGQSRRMGRDKAQLVFGGQTLIERITGEMSAVTPSVSLVGARQNYAGFQIVPDIHPQWGALGGIHAALTATESDWALVVACDLPFVTSALFERLKSLATDTIDAVVPIQPDGRPQPVCALYRRAGCLPEIEQLIASGEHTPRALLANVRTRCVQFRELDDLPHAERLFLNLNTPADLEVAQKLHDEG